MRARARPTKRDACGARRRAPPRWRSGFRRSSIRFEDRRRLGLDRNALRAQLRRRLLHDLARFIGEPRGIIDVPLVLSHRSAQDSVVGSAKESKAMAIK